MTKEAAAKKKEGEEETPVIYNYKGTMVDVSALDGQSGIPCEAPETVIKEFSGKFGKCAASKLPKLFILTGIGPSPYGTESRYLTYAAYPSKSFKTGGVYLPADFKVKRLEGRQRDKMSEKYSDHQLSTGLAGALHHSWSIGGDGEVFGVNKEGVIIPAFDFLEVRSKGNRTGSGTQKAFNDGFVASFNTLAQGCLAFMTDNVRLGLKTIYEQLMTVDKGARLSIRPVQEIPQKLLALVEKEETALHDKVPVMNAYSMSPKVISLKEKPFRVAGFDIHYGLGGQLPPDRISEIVKSLDAILGVACVSLFAEMDNPVFREDRLPGDFRLVPHGLEYRGLSATALAHPAIFNLVVDLSRKVVRFAEGGFRRYWANCSESTAIDIMKTGDVGKARQILEQNKSLLLKLFKAANYADPDTAYKVLVEGIGSAVESPDDVIGNWCLNGSWTTHAGDAYRNWASACAAIKAGKKV